MNIYLCLVAGGVRSSCVHLHVAANFCRVIELTGLRAQPTEEKLPCMLM